MTPEQIRKMTDEEMLLRIAGILGWADLRFSIGRWWGTRPGKTSGVIGSDEVPVWPLDLNAAMSLVPQHVGTRESAKQLEAFYEEFLYATGIGGGDNLYDMFKDFGGDRSVKLPRVLCESFLLWKDGAK